MISRITTTTDYQVTVTGAVGTYFFPTVKVFIIQKRVMLIFVIWISLSSRN